MGFLYLSNSPVAQCDIDALVDYIPYLFALPQEAKVNITVAYSLHFLEYSRLGSKLKRGQSAINYKLLIIQPQSTSHASRKNSYANMPSITIFNLHHPTLRDDNLLHPWWPTSTPKVLYPVQHLPNLPSVTSLNTTLEPSTKLVTAI